MSLDKTNSNPPTIQSLRALAPNEVCTDDFGIVDGVCTLCQNFKDFTLKEGMPSRWYHSLRTMLWAEKLGCRVCRFILDYPLENPATVGPYVSEYSQDITIKQKMQIYRDGASSWIISPWFLRFDMAVSPGDPLATENLTYMTSLATTHITPELCNSFVRQQTKLCGDNHPACPSITVEKMPKRVIDVSPYEPEIPFGLVYPRLIATKGLTDPWVTLSYCWGSDGSMVTATKASISGFMEKIDVSALPKTFQDAIMVVKAIGHRYLWIDALCIIQDDPADLADELAQMCNIYKNSALTLAIDGASSVSQGFLGPRIGVNSVTLPYHNLETGLKGNLEIRNSLVLRGKFDVLGTRGWGLQETVLSPRSLHVSKQQLFWCCQSFSCSEGNLTSHRAPDELDDGAMKRFFLQDEPKNRGGVKNALIYRTEFLLESWYRIVGDYASRSLSFSTDTFPAIAGLAEEIQRQTNLTYGAGLWEQDVHRGLIWYANGGTRPRVFQAPSWSWASVCLRDSLHIYRGVVKERGRLKANRMISDVKMASLHMKGTARPFTDTPSEDSYLLIRARWVTTSPAVWLKRDQPFCNKPGKDFGMYYFPKDTHKFKDGTFSKKDEGPRKGQILCDFDYETGELPEERLSSASYLLIAHHSTETSDIPKFKYDLLWCLMLVPTGNADDEFKRVGLARIPRRKEWREPGWMTRTIKIF